RIRPTGEHHRIPRGALVERHRHRDALPLPGQLVRRVDAVEAISDPVVRPVIEYRHRGESLKPFLTVDLFIEQPALNGDPFTRMDTGITAEQIEIQAGGVWWAKITCHRSSSMGYTLSDVGAGAC